MSYRYEEAEDPFFLKKPCKSCTDFKSWSKQQGEKINKKIEQDEYIAREKMECPLDRNQLGSKTWGLLHTMASTYPENPTTKQQKDIKCFFHFFSRVYPCEDCATHLRKDLKDSPPKTESQESLSMWLCELHNNVNERIGKPLFDCSKVFERWRDGWKDGRCD